MPSVNPKIFGTRLLSLIKKKKLINTVSFYTSYLFSNTAPWPTLLTKADLLNYRNIVVFAPHPDDESFGMGGTLVLLSQLKTPFSINWFTNGKTENRVGEAHKMLACLGPSVSGQFLSDKKTISFGHASAIIEKIILNEAPDLICLPSFFDPHYDHARLVVALAKSITKLKWEGWVLLYEVWNTIVPNRLIDISAVVEKKKTLMQCFESQIADKELNYEERMIALNRYRGLTFSLKYAEGFILCRGKDLVKCVKGISLDK